MTAELDDDTPEAIVDAINASLLAREPGGGRPVIWIWGRPHPDPGYPEPVKETARKTETAR